MQSPKERCRTRLVQENCDDRNIAMYNVYTVGVKFAMILNQPSPQL